MSRDPLMEFFADLRVQIVKEGAPAAMASQKTTIKGDHV
jgi:hypothetical protein